MSQSSSPSAGRTVLHYFSLHSPWAFLGYAPFMEVAARHGVHVEHRPVQLGALFAETGGLPLARRHPARQHYRIVEIKRWQAKRGLDFHIFPEHWPYDPGLADRMIIAATDAGLDPDPLIRRLFAGVWQRQENLADPAALLEALTDIGLTGDLLIEAAGTRTAIAYARNGEEAAATDVFGSPGYVLDGEVFWGQDRIELLDDALSSGRPPFTAET